MTRDYADPDAFSDDETTFYRRTAIGCYAAYVALVTLALYLGAPLIFIPAIVPGVVGFLSYHALARGRG